MRTRLSARITLTARELSAVKRFLNRRTIGGDVALVESVMREIVGKVKK